MNQIAAQERGLYLQKCHIEVPVIGGFTPVSLPHGGWRTAAALYAALDCCRLTTRGVEGTNVDIIKIVSFEAHPSLGSGSLLRQNALLRGNRP